MISLAIALVLAPVVVIGYAYVGYPALLKLASLVTRRRVAADYPASKRHIVVISDASTDRTDEIAREYADRGIELVRLSQRRGKSAAENAGAAAVSDDLVVKIDA